MNNKKWLWAFLLALPLFTGCIIETSPGGGGPASGNATFTWTFGGGDCSTLPVGSYVVIAIPGQQLGQTNGQFACTSGGVNGIVLESFDPGTYPFTIDAYDASQNHLATGSGSFTVNGDVSVPVDLTLLSTTPSLTWTFPSNGGSDDATCATAGAYGGPYASDGFPLYVDVSIDSAAFTRYACTDGNGGASVPLATLSQGAHSIIVNAVSSSSATYSAADEILFTTTVTPTIGPTTPVSAALDYAVGGVEVSWALSNGVTQTCAQAGITTVWVNFQGSAGVVYGTAGDFTTWSPVACADSGGAATVGAFGALPADTYLVLMQGSNTDGSGNPIVPYYVEQAITPPSVVVTTGVFPTDVGSIATVALVPSP